MTERHFNWLRWGCFALAVATLAWLFFPTVMFTLSMFSDPHEDLSHGWAIPVVSGYAVWRARAQLRTAMSAPSWRGLLMLALCLFLCWLGNRGEQMRLVQFGLFGCVAALPMAFWGRGVARLLLFPAAYLCFAIPASFLDSLTFQLRLLATAISGSVLNGMGIVVQQVGTAMISTSGAGFKLDVADPCSGLRSIFAMAALTAAYAFFTQQTALRRGLLFAAAAPLAVIGNVTRIISIGVVAHCFGQEKALGFYHDYSGYVVFVVAVLLMMQLGSWIDRIGSSPAVVASPPATVPAAAAGGNRRLSTLAPCLLAFLLALLCLVAVRVSPSMEIEPDTFIAVRQPAQIGVLCGQQPFYCHNDQCLACYLEGEIPHTDNPVPVCPRCGQPLSRISLGERNMLPGDTRIGKSTYLSVNGFMLATTFVVSGKSRLSLHRPEMCLPGQGFELRDKVVRTVDLGQGRQLCMNVFRAARAGERPIGFLYWFVCPRMTTTSHWTRIFSDVWDRSVHNRINRWCMFSVFCNQSFDDPDVWRATEQFLREWYPQVMRAGFTNNAPAAVSPAPAAASGR